MISIKLITFTNQKTVQIIPKRLSINIILFKSMSDQQQQSRQSQHSLKVQDRKIKQIKTNPKSQIRMKYQKQQDSHQSLSNQFQQQPKFQSLANLTSMQQLKKKANMAKKIQISNFIIKTYRILEDPINSDIIQWTDQGNAFIVKKKQKFQNFILPKYFKHRKFSSFVRQLNMYDFHKIRKQKQIPIFRHKYFKQGCVDLLCRIKRKSGDEGMPGGNDEDENITINNTFTRNYIPSLADLTQKPMMSAMSFRSKSHLPDQGILPSQPSIGMFPVSGSAHSTQLDQLLQQNQQLTAAISELTHQQVTLQMQKQRKSEKLIKIFNVLLNFDLNENNQNEKGQLTTQCDNSHTLRDLQDHFSSEQDPLSFSHYLYYLKNIYQNVKLNLVKMNNAQAQQKQEHQMQQQMQRQIQKQIQQQ